MIFVKSSSFVPEPPIALSARNAGHISSSKDGTEGMVWIASSCFESGSVTDQPTSAEVMSV
jgi:hypothetical protein